MYCQSILDSAKLLQSLVSDILDYSKVDRVSVCCGSQCTSKHVRVNCMQVEAGRMDMERIPLHLHDLLRSNIRTVEMTRDGLLYRKLWHAGGRYH